MFDWMKKRFIISCTTEKGFQNEIKWLESRGFIRIRKWVNEDNVYVERWETERTIYILARDF